MLIRKTGKSLDADSLNNGTNLHPNQILAEVVVVGVRLWLPYAYVDEAFEWMKLATEQRRSNVGLSDFFPSP